MCGRYYVDDEMAKEIEKIVRNLDNSIEEEKNNPEKVHSSIQNAYIDVYPTNRALTILNSNEHLERKNLIWGYQNFKKSGVVFNARSESILEKPMFRNSMINYRCIIPARGFYEWTRSRDKVAFERSDKDMMYLAAIYQMNSEVERFVILTTKANSSVEDIHPRMPLVLEHSDLLDWIFDFNKARTLLEKVPTLLERKFEYLQETFCF